MKLIFVCTGNTCRSPLAEYLMKDYCKKNNLDIEVESRGLACSNDRPISENSKMALAEIGIDASEHKSKSFTIKDLFEADLIVTMTREHKYMLNYHFNKNDDEKVKSFNELTGLGEVHDPFACDLDVYRRCRNQLLEGIKKIADYLENMK